MKLANNVNTNVVDSPITKTNIRYKKSFKNFKYLKKDKASAAKIHARLSETRNTFGTGSICC